MKRNGKLNALRILFLVIQDFKCLVQIIGDLNHINEVTVLDHIISECII